MASFQPAQPHSECEPTIADLLFVWKDYQCYSAVMCDAFRQVCIIDEYATMHIVVCFLSI